MSDRRAQRAARGHRRVEMATADVPACLAVGRLVEVWAAADLPGSTISALGRYSVARTQWIASSADPEQTRARAAWHCDSTPWCTEFLSYRGQAERIGRPIEDIVDERLERAGVALADLPDLAAEAADLFNRATQGAKQ